VQKWPTKNSLTFLRVCRNYELVAKLEKRVEEEGHKAAQLARQLAAARVQQEQMELLLHDQAHSEKMHRLEEANAAAAARVDTLESDLAKVRSRSGRVPFEASALLLL
jgi:hypothetical protein